jgi:predicted O-methyltransferase YrrM
MAEYYGADWNWASWGNLLESVRTGKTAFDITHNAALFEYLERHADAAVVFDRYMAAMPTRWREAVVAAYDFSGKKLIVDVGGGLGAFLIAVLQANPGLRGLLFDQPDVLTRAQALLAAADVGDRCNCVAGDLFEAVPAGGDLYFLSNIIHDWDDERAVVILRNCRRAMPPGSLLLIREQVLPEGAEPSLAKRTDMIMLALTGGRQRTESEFRSLLHQADLLLTSVVPLGAGSALIEAAPTLT